MKKFYILYQCPSFTLDDTIIKAKTELEARTLFAAQFPDMRIKQIRIWTK